jgi:hypothetical protein
MTRIKRAVRVVRRWLSQVLSLAAVKVAPELGGHDYTVIGRDGTRIAIDRQLHISGHLSVQGGINLPDSSSDLGDFYTNLAKGGHS